MKNQPIRMDIGTRETFPKEELLRLVVVDGQIVIDEEQNLPGRGCYLAKNPKSLEIAIKRNLITRHLHHPVSSDLIEEIRSKL